MTTSHSYDHPDYTISRYHMTTPAAGTGTKRILRVFPASEAIAAHWRVITAGTADAFTIAWRSGTTAISTTTVGTQTAGAVGSVDLANTAVASLDVFNGLVAGDDTGVVEITYTYKLDDRATLSN